jgi:D-methionine transport system ATP-binding protein
LDLGTANYLLTVLNELSQSQNLTVVIVNHQLELIKDFCDRLLLIEGGILAEDVPATESNWQRLTQKIVQLQLQEEDWL